MGIFPLSDNVCGIYLMLLCTIFIWLCDLDLRPFDLGSVSCVKLHTSNAHTYAQFTWYCVCLRNGI